MRIMGIDYGRVRVGVALSDETQQIAMGLATLKRTSRQSLLDALCALAAQHHVERIVLGCPLRLDGSEQPLTHEVQRLADALQARLRVPIELVDERLTSWEAEQMLKERRVRGKKRKARLDQVAAAIILQNYLDAQRAARTEAFPSRRTGTC